ncbi:putative 2-aminoethylphosphonate ABC transporter ATP-binding protein [Ignatzschineria sp. LJL83]
MNQSYLQLSGIHKRFGNFTALKEIDLSLNRGELICFLGPSGCGKTTLLRIIAGLETQSSGMIHQDGRDISHAPIEKRDYGIVFQSYALFPNLTIYQNIAYGLVNQKMPKKAIKARVTELLETVGLSGSENKYPAQLSGGQQQRIALARALATSPNLLLLDEPLSALDATVRTHLRQEICHLQKKLGITTIMVTHDQEEALSIADRIVVMNHGKIEQVGTPFEIYSNPVSPFVASFVGRVNQISGKSLGNRRFQFGEQTVSLPDNSENNENPENIPQGDNVMAYIRPEDYEIVADQQSNQTEGFTGIIENLEFLGSHTLATFNTPENDTPLTLLFSLQDNLKHQISIGKSLKIRFPESKMNIFRSA